MRASNTYPSNGSKVTKIAIVTMLHLGVALPMINMKMVVKDVPKIKPIDVKIEKTVVVEPEPVEVDLSTKKIDPTIFAPQTDFKVDPLPDTPVAKVLPAGPPPVITTGGTDKGTEIVEHVAPPAAAKKTFTVVSAGDCARPDYPAHAARVGESGTVTLALLIGVDGRVTDSKVSSSSGSRELDRAAVAALSSCKFKPATNNGVAEPAWGKIAYAWSLAD